MLKQDSGKEVLRHHFINKNERSKTNIFADKGIMPSNIHIYLNKGSKILITQEQLPMVAMPSMNDTHLEEILIINRLETASRDSDIEAVHEILKELLEHTEIHFSDEEDTMEEAVFPAFKMHKSEHDRHLHELKSVIKYFEEHKDTRAISAYIEGNLTPWLKHHIETMDTMTALFLQQENVTGCSATK